MFLKLFPWIIVLVAISCSKKEQCAIQDLSRIESRINNEVIEDLDTVENNLSLFMHFNLSCKKNENSELVHGLDYKTVKIEFDKAFVLKGSTIESGTNLANLEYENLIKGQHTEPIEEYTIKYEFYEEFFLSAVFDSTLYQLTFEIKTSDGKILKASKSHYFK